MDDEQSLMFHVDGHRKMLELLEVPYEAVLSPIPLASRSKISGFAHPTPLVDRTGALWAYIHEFISGKFIFSACRLVRHLPHGK